MLEIRSWADWPEIEKELTSQIKGLNFNSDLNKMKRNLDAMVSELNRAEVEARRTNGHKYLAQQIAEINRSIDLLEKWILMLALRQ